MPLTPRRLAPLAVAALLVGCGGGQAATENAGAPERPVVLVSGRDDHGLLSSALVDLADGPDRRAERSVPDGTLAAVVDTAGEWVELRTLTGPVARGWANDFHLRGTVHLRARPGECEVSLLERPAGAVRTSVPANSQATLRTVVRADGVTWVQVRALTGQAGWVGRDAVHELPGDRVAATGAECKVIEPAHEQDQTGGGHHHGDDRHGETPAEHGD